jgi:predicted nucleotidyltransferase
MVEGFLDDVADRLAALPAVRAVTLGGSRAQGTNRPDSDWDLAVYYRGDFEPQALRDIGWEGEVSEIGGWSTGVFNGGAWLRVDGRPVDVHYRDLDVVEREIDEARQGRFRVEPLMFHLAGIPSYLVVAELAVNRVLRGELPRPSYPSALREQAPPVWWGSASFTLAYAEANHAPYGRLAQCAGLLAQAASQAAHAVLAARGEWITNEKQLLTEAGLREVDRILGDLRPEPEQLRAAVEAVRSLCERAVEQAR